MQRIADYAYYEIARSNPNLFSNSDFRYKNRIINQKNITSITGNNKNCIDRWILFGGMSPIFELYDGYVQIKNETSSKEFSQRFEYIEDGIYTASCLTKDNKLAFSVFQVKNGFVNVLKTYSEQPGLIMDYADKTNEEYVRFGIFVSSANSVLLPSAMIVAMKSEEGPTQTLARKVGDQWVLNDPPPDPTLELLKCQRYQIQLCQGRFGLLGSGFAASATEAHIFIPLPTQMRGIPEAVYSGRFTVKTGAENINSTPEVESMTVEQFTSNGCFLNVKTTGLRMDIPYQLWYTPAKGNAIFLLDANL